MRTTTACGLAPNSRGELTALLDRRPLRAPLVELLRLLLLLFDLPTPLFPVVLAVSPLPTSQALPLVPLAWLGPVSPLPRHPCPWQRLSLI